jgi:hypothetical protein
MYSNNYLKGSSVAYRILIVVITLLLVPLAPAVRAATAETGFTVQPDKCIALHQGQVCYQDLEFNWQTPASGEYCLYEVPQREAVVCWSGAQQRSHNLEFASATSTLYQIRTMGSEDVLSQVTVEVAWVYRANRKSFSRWRLF